MLGALATPAVALAINIGVGSVPPVVPNMPVAPTLGPAITLSDANSVVTVNPALGGGGMNDWYIDGQDYLTQQWLWYRVGSTGPEKPIDTISAPTVTQPAPNVASISYSTANFSLSVTYLLTGGEPGSHSSDVAETIKVVNKSTASRLRMSLFQYTDFDITPKSLPADKGYIIDTGYPNDVAQIGLTSFGALKFETIATPAPSFYEVSPVAAILAKLNNATPDTLNNSPAAVGDVAWAYQWDFNIAPRGNVIISKDKNVVPINVPDGGSTVVIFGLALTALGFFGLRSRK